MESKTCIICNETEDGEQGDRKIQKVYKAGLASMIEACVSENPEEFLDLLQSYTDNIEVIHPYVHADCRKRLIGVRKRSGEDTVGRSRQKSRRILPNRVLKWEDKCILCAQHIVSLIRSIPIESLRYIQSQFDL